MEQGENSVSKICMCFIPHAGYIILLTTSCRELTLLLDPSLLLNVCIIIALLNVYTMSLTQSALMLHTQTLSDDEATIQALVPQCKNLRICITGKSCVFGWALTTTLLHLRGLLSLSLLCGSSRLCWLP